MNKTNDYEESELDELTSVKIFKRTLKWIHRLKTIYERQTGKTFSIDSVIYNAVTYTDWVYARYKGETQKDVEEYSKEIEKKMAEDKDTVIHGLIEEYESFATKIVPVPEEEQKKKDIGEENDGK
jgi:hypothetical protein